MEMKYRIIRAFVPLFLSSLVAIACGCISRGQEKTENIPSVPGTAPGMRLISPLPAGEWRLPAGDYANTRFSPLDQINTGNAKNLKVVTTFSTGVPFGHEGQPLVVNNTMYVVTPYPNNLIAVDLTKPGGAIKWVYEPH